MAIGSPFIPSGEFAPMQTTNVALSPASSVAPRLASRVIGRTINNLDLRLTKFPEQKLRAMVFETVARDVRLQTPVCVGCSNVKHDTMQDFATDTTRILVRCDAKEGQKITCMDGVEGVMHHGEFKVIPAPTWQTELERMSKVGAGGPFVPGQPSLSDWMTSPTKQIIPQPYHAPKINRDAPQTEGEAW